MTKGGTLQQLEHETTDCVRVKCATVSMLIHILLEILLAIFKDQDQFRFCVYYVVETNNVDMFEFFHKRYFPNRGRWGPFFGVKMNFF